MEEDGAMDSGDEDFVGEEDLQPVLTLDDRDEAPDEDMDEPDPQPLAQPHMEFAAHQGDIFTVDLFPPMAASGGEDDKAFVFEIATGKPLLACTGHKDSVTWVRANGKKTLLATGDMSGLIKIWNLETMKFHTEFNDASDLEWLCWHPLVDILLAGARDGMVWMWLIPTKDCKVFPGQGLPATAGRLLPDGKRLLAGYGNGACLLWDLRAGTSVTVTGCARHTVSITAVAVAPSAQVGASGTEQGGVGIVNLSSGRYETLFECEEEEMEAEDRASVESLEFSPDSSLLGVGTVSGAVVVWGVGPGAVRHRLLHPTGVLKLAWLGSHSLLSATLDGRLSVWDSRSGEALAQYIAHSKELFDFATAEEGGEHLVLTASADRTSKLFMLS